MSDFDSKDFGERLKTYRLKKGLSQENIATIINKTKATVSRYESGEVLPDVKDISKICAALEIYEADLYENNVVRTMQDNKSKNPFNTNKLYVFFYAYNFRTKKFAPDKYILELEQKQNICNGTDGLMLGGYFGTNAKCEPSLRKCYFSKRDIEFTKEIIMKM